MWVSNYNKSLLCYNLCQLLLASIFLSYLCPIPALYAKTPDCYDIIFPLFFHCTSNVHGWFPIDCLWSLVNDISRAMRGQGGREGSGCWQKCLREGACKIILARKLLHQAEAQYQVPIQLPVLQGVGKERSADNTGVQLRDRDCNPDADPDMHVWYGFLKFFCHESTKGYEYDYSLLLENAID